MSRQPSWKEKKGGKGKSKAGLGYMPGLDGLRAFAVLAVLLYHADLHWFQGGFLGVEIFFVISGYLITSLLLVEWQDKGRINLKQFWLRRARRLLPALFLLLLATLTLAVLLLPDEVAILRGDVAAALGYVTNWYLILSNKSYFESVGRPGLLQHLWSLAVEEQFYVLWPLLLTLLLSRLRAERARYLILAGAIASAVLMAVLYQPDADPSRVYYGTDTRASGLLTGAVLAFIWRPWQLKKQAKRFSKNALDLAGVAGLAVLLWACLYINEYWSFLYQGGFTVVSLATVLAIAVAVHPRARLGKRFLSWRPLVWVGVRSYGIYLWHWPIFDVTRPHLDLALDGLPLLALRFGLTLIVAELSYRFVETPIRTGALGRAWQAWREAQGTRRTRLGWGYSVAVTAAVALVLVLGNAAVRAKPPAPPAYLAELVQPTPSQVDMRQVVSPSEPIVAVTEQPVTLSSFASSSSEFAVESGAVPAEAAAASSGGQVEQKTSDEQAPDIAERPRMQRGAAGASSEENQSVALTATPEPPLVTGIAVTAVGDSVMLGAAPALVQAIQGIDVDAQVSRQVATAVEILNARQAAGRLGTVVIVHMGTNGGFSARQFDQIMQAVGDVRRVIFVNDKVPRPWEDTNNAAIADGVKRYPQAVLVDWQTASTPHPELFWGDGIHLRPEGARFYARLIAQAILAP